MRSMNSSALELRALPLQRRSNGVNITPVPQERNILWWTLANLRRSMCYDLPAAAAPHITEPRFEGRNDMLIRTIFLGLAIACAPLWVAAAEEQKEAYLTEEEHQELLKLLDESRDNLMERITGLTDEQWNFKPNVDRWSVGECVEHIVRSERALLDYAIGAIEAGPDKEWAEKTKGKTDLIRRVMPNRNPGGAGGAQAPMEIRPTENWTRADAIKKFYAMRGEVVAYCETIDKPIKGFTKEHPFPVFGWLSAHDWLIYVPLHTVRHTRQLIEVQEHENYPGK